MSYREAETAEAPPVMLRKKSGEIVRPVLKPRTSKSEPTTPTCAKTVHFDINLEQIRLFLRAETPAAVTGDPTNVDADADVGEDEDVDDDYNPLTGELTCSLPNWPPANFSSLPKPVHVEPVSISQDKASLIGKVQVQNLAYHKRVVVRYTFDDWETVGEIQAKYYESLSKNMSATTYDVFSFSISLKGMVGDGVAPEDEHTSMFFAVKYSVDGRDIWDNNNGSNYFVEFKRKSASKSAPAEASAEWTMDDVDQETYPSTANASYSSSPEINPAAKSKTFSRYDFPSSVTATKKNSVPVPVPVPSLPAQVRPAHHSRVKPSLPYIGNHPTVPGFSTGPTVDGYPASLYPDSYSSSSIEQPIANTRNAIPIAITVPAAKSSTFEKSNPKETSGRIFGTSPISGGGPRPSPNSSSYFDFVSKYCFYDSNTNPYSTSPYSNSPPLQLIRG
jgi:hypothetical protein